MPDRVARFIAPDEEFDGAPRLRRQIELDAGHGPVQRASLLVTALGICEVWVNGRPVSDEVLTPGWSAYEWRLRTREHDVTALIEQTTVIGIALGNGWYRGRIGWDGDRALYGAELAGFAELRVHFSDGHEQVIGTDGSWTSGPSATTANDLYDGQSIDARRHGDAWLAADFDAYGWAGVHIVDVDDETLEPAIAPPVRRHEHVGPVRAWLSPAGRTLVDFGQNLVGWLRVSVRGEAGEVVTIRHAEVLEHGELGTRPLRSAQATDRFTLSGGDDEFEPTFTFHGFRYVEVDGWPGDLDSILGGITAVVVMSDLRRTGWFRTSNDMLNRLHENIVWGMRGNFVDVPTDCPQRDERLGWTGDLSVFAPTAAFLYDAQDFLRDWLRDLAIEQSHKGAVPIVVPDAEKYFTLPEGMPQPGTTAIWGDAAVWVPWAVWTAYGDRRVLADQFDSMMAHARAIEAMLEPGGIWTSGFQFGDWLDPDAPPEAPFRSKADPHVVATLCAFRTAGLVAAAAEVLGDVSARDECAALASRIREGFAAEYLRDGVIESDCTTVYTLAIVFGVLDDDDLAAAGKRLAALVRASGHRISTGFAGTPFIADALTLTGHLEDAYRLLLQTECPSWLYAVTMGATTVWERWDSMLPDGTINPGGMTSFNHYALGSVADWMHRTIGGLAALDPGYERLLVAPRPGGGLTWAHTELDTRRGRASVRWETDPRAMTVELTVPDGAEAVLRLPGTADEVIPAGTHRRTVPITHDDKESS
ncbi:alpha-L-rhamnosidase [Microbacterium hominis]|uniref:alpha-L-rhamnosidase n=1 Tax=Microbacterium hominis TaxID=162426 RepID=A0A7D4Q9Z9_9MICO|nr:alpha-L-rhamnosidase [Microbacterium hominis]QKJ20879.1 family 78 glycoside hydrolase catalytic domain [Microbacterium hominis]